MTESLCQEKARHLLFRVAGFSRGSPRSVFHAHADDDENRIVLLRAALDGRHHSPWSNWKRGLLNVCRRARTTNRGRCIARGAAGQVRHVVECRAFVELPAAPAIPLGGMNGQHSRHLAAARDQVFAGRERKGRLLHDQAVFLQPPVRAIEFPARGGDTCLLQPCKAVQLDASRTRVQRPQTPRLCAAPEGRAWSAQRCDELCRYALELRLTSACGVGLASMQIERGKHEQAEQKENQEGQRKRRTGRRSTLCVCHLDSSGPSPIYAWFHIRA